MYRWVRTATPQAGKLGEVVPALKELTGHVKSKHNVDLTMFVERFGKVRVHWSVDGESIAEIEKFIKALEADEDYAQKVAVIAPNLMSGHTHDTVVESV